MHSSLNVMEILISVQLHKLVLAERMLSVHKEVAVFAEQGITENNAS